MRNRLLVAIIVGALSLSVFASLPGPAAAESAPEEQTVLQELFALGRSLDETRAAAGKVTAQIAETAGRQAEAAAERDRLEVRRRERQAQFSRRLRYYQAEGRVAPLAVLLGSNSFIDFLSRLDLLSQVLEHDAALIREVRALRAAVTQQEQALRSTAAELEQLRSQLAASEAKLQAEIARREAVLASLQDRRAAVEAELAGLERVWKERAEPLLIALGMALQKTDPATFEPDQVSMTLFPPGATALVSGASVTRFFGQVAELKGLAFQIRPEAMIIEGQYDGVPLRIAGAFLIADKTTLRFAPQSIRIQEFDVPTESIARLLAANPIDIDVSGMVGPLVLKSVEMQENQLRIKAGIK